MEWRNLSDEAQGIIEWVVNPFTDKKRNNNNQSRRIIS